MSNQELTSNEEQNSLGSRARLRAYCAPALLLALALSVSGCAAGTAKSQPKSLQTSAIVPCDTDSDCESKNDPKPAEVFYCEAITKAGTRCKRHVHEAGLLCKQHSKMVKEGKTVKTID